MLYVHPSFQVRTLKALIAAGKAKPLSYASPGIGTTPHLTVELLLKTMNKLELTHVPYNGAAPALNAVLGGQLVLGCGALLKNTFCLAHGDSAYLGPHVGDLDNLDVYDDYVRSIDRLETFLKVKPEIVAHDLHPDYLSTRYALSRTDATAIAVQHHHAHVVAAMAEHGLEGPVLEFLERRTDFEEVAQRLGDLLEYVLPRYLTEHRAYLTIGIGCTGGRHRSVAMVERLARRLQGADWNVRKIHRDIAREGVGPAAANDLLEPRAEDADR